MRNQLFNPINKEEALDTRNEIIDDRTIIETYGGGYGSSGVVEEVSKYLKQHRTRLPEAFFRVAIARGLDPQSESYQLLLRAVGRELGSRPKNRKGTACDKRYDFTGNIELWGEKVRYAVQCNGCSIIFERGERGQIIRVSSFGFPSERMVRAATDYVRIYWKHDVDIIGATIPYTGYAISVTCANREKIVFDVSGISVTFKNTRRSKWFPEISSSPRAPRLKRNWKLLGMLKHRAFLYFDKLEEEVAYKQPLLF